MFFITENVTFVERTTIINWVIFNKILQPFESCINKILFYFFLLIQLLKEGNKLLNVDIWSLAEMHKWIVIGTQKYELSR